MQGKLHIIVLFALICENSFAQKNDTNIESLLKKTPYHIDLSSSQKAMHTVDMLPTENDLNDQEINSQIGRSKNVDEKLKLLSLQNLTIANMINLLHKTTMT